MEFSNTGGMRSPFSPRVRQSIAGRKSIGMSARKNQGKFLQSSSPQTGDVIYKTPMSTYETYGSPLPVMVTETLTFASGEVSVRISPCGWCWLVAGRRVVAWAREPRGEQQAAPARELTLPQTDLAHKADLVEMFYEDGAQMPSMVGVSPEGVVRYWWSVGHESASVDVSCELAGQEGHRLLAGRHCLLLATTTCSVLLLTARRLEGRATVSVRVLRPPSGWLGGLGRRVSLLFFGSMPHADTKLVGVVMLSEGALGAEAGEGGGGEGPGLLAVLGGGAGGPLLQLWAGDQLAEHCLRRALAERHAELGSVELTALDIRAGEGDRSLLVLLAVGDVREPELRYALAHISVEEPLAPRVRSVQTLRWGGELGPRLLPLPGAALLYGRAGLARLGTSANDKVDLVDVSCEGDSILAAELCDGVPLVFSRKHGLLALVAAEPLLPSVCDSPMDSPCPSDMYDGNLSLYEIDPHEVAAVSTDAAGKLKAAFLLWVRRAEPACAALLAQLGPAPPGLPAALARGLLDDAPAGDPRWAARGPHTNVPLGASAALRHDQQLRDKARALSLYRAFLRARLAPALPPSEAASMERSLAVLAGELAMVRGLRRLHDGPDADVITAAIDQVVCGSGAVEEEPEVEAALSSGALAPADVFYRRVTAAKRVLRALARPPPGAAPAAAAAHIVHQVLSAGQQARCQWGDGAVGSDPDVLPPLLHLLRRTLSEAQQCADATVKWRAIEAGSALADQLLADDPHISHSMRSDLIRPFVEAGLTERARVLAEKFGDYELLVELCLQEEDMDRLYGYMDKYANEGVAEIAFARIVDRGGSALPHLLREARGGLARRLEAWLRPPHRRPLLAARRLAAHDPRAAAEPLAALAADDTDSLNRMMTTASLAKLCLLASEESDRESSELRRKVEDCLALGEQHLSLPRDIRVHHGLDADDTRVLPPEDIVEMYVTSESSTLSEYDLKKALDLTELVRDLERRDELRLKVWCCSVTRDSWDDAAADDVLRDKLVFRLAALVLLLGGDLELSLPPLQDLVSAPELAHLSEEPKFRYLLQYGYHALHHDDDSDAVIAT